MTIDPTVRAKAAYFGVPADLIQAVVQAEGGNAAFVRAVQCSIPSVQTFEKAVEVGCRSAAHAMSDWILEGGEPRQDDFLAFWQRRWAPTGAANDPKNLNVNWASNVDRLWTPTEKSA